jgi:HAD superfamily hydrolase (TIGR01484 family)
MAPTHYDAEMAHLGATYEAALRHSVAKVKAAIAGASESSIIGVGTGGSFTVASLLCNLHETYTGRVSRAATSLEIISNPTLASSSPVFLISAEGKNPDIVEALRRARTHSARPIHVVTNRASSPLFEAIQQLTDITTHVFELSEKDGYLATNSLLLDAVLVARAYGELAHEDDHIPNAISGLSLADGTIDEWLNNTTPFIESAVSSGNLIITYSPLLRPIAADLESRLSEAALLHCQVADLRSLGHGRHLWFAQRPTDCAVLALIEPSLADLWDRMRDLIPDDIPTLSMRLAGARPKDLLSGLVAQMRFVGMLGARYGRDIGRPVVPQFGRDLYYIDLPMVIPRHKESADHGEQAKYNVLGARWPSGGRRGSMQRAATAFKMSVEAQTFRGIVFDYDGTLCPSQRDDSPPPNLILTHLERLLTHNVIVGVASGRGGSVQEQLRDCLPDRWWTQIQLALYSGGWLTDLQASDRPAPVTSEFLSHVERMVRRLKSLGVPIDTIRTTHPYQVSVRFREGLQTEGMWFVVADALRQAGLDVSRMVRSKHSVDILAPNIDKSHLIAHLIARYKIDPYDILAVGDQGAWPGNDYSLLEHKFSLSVDSPSRRLDRGWKLAPAHKRDVDATVWYLDRLHLLGEGRFALRFDTPIAGGMQ